MCFWGAWGVTAVETGKKMWGRDNTIGLKEGKKSDRGRLRGKEEEVGGR